MKKGLRNLGCLAMLFTLVLGMTSCGEEKAPTTDNNTTENGGNQNEGTGQEDNKDDEATKIHTVAEILELCDKNEAEKRYQVKGIVKKVTNPMYGEMDIEDATGVLYVYGFSKKPDEAYENLEDKPMPGDEIVLEGIPSMFGEKKQFKDAVLKSIEHPEKPAFNEADYKAMSIDEARVAVNGTKIKVTGTVARITYSSGHKPSGVILVDGTNSIYVYDMMIASEAKIGNKVTVCGERDAWINADEQYNAEKFGYKGCTQLSSCHKVSIDKTVTPVDYSWVKESTVKNIVENDPKIDITSTIYKVNALITKVVNPGFTNYYINDLDGKTGSYVYSQCNGGDFTWLDEFDGKICTVYLSPLNAKATSAGIQYRFLPIDVKFENYEFDLNNGPEFALEYFAVGQFGNNYMVSPDLELEKTVSFESIGLNDVKLSYESANPEVLSFVEENGKIVMKTVNDADNDVAITITAAHGENKYKKSIIISVKKTPDYQAVNVKAAIDAEVGETVTVMGKVGASLVNRDGFYLIDETGVIAITTTKDVLAQVKPGNVVVLTGTKALIGKSDSAPEYHFQLVLKDATLDVNLFGKGGYSTASFTEMTLAEAKELDVNTHANTERGITVADVTFKFTGGGYSTNVFVCQGDVEIMLYCSGSKQYKWLEQYEGKTVKVDMAVCNWNSAKGGYKATILAVYNEDGTKTINKLNFSK